MSNEYDAGFKEGLEYIAGAWDTGGPTIDRSFNCLPDCDGKGNILPVEGESEVWNAGWVAGLKAGFAFVEAHVRFNKEMDEIVLATQ